MVQLYVGYLWPFVSYSRNRTKMYEIGSSIEIDDLGNNLEHLCGSFRVLHQHCVSNFEFIYKLM